MAWLTVDDMIDHVPLDVYDANGMVIRRKITGFDPETGKVESFVCTTAGVLVKEPEGGEFKRRLEAYPAPLTWRKISHVEADQAKRLYWDFQGK